MARVIHDDAARLLEPSVPVAVVVPFLDGYQVQVWQGDFDLDTRTWNGPHHPCRAESGLIHNKRLAFEMAGEMMEDLACVAVMFEDAN